MEKLVKCEYMHFRLESSRPAPVSSTRHQQRMSPFDELMAQHQQQLQRERQLLRIANTGNTRPVTGDGAAKIIPPPPVKLDDIEPPFEYSTPAMSELPKKSLSETTADVKKGLLSSFLEKVRSKEEADQAARQSNSKQNRLMAPLASSESLSVSEASSKRPLSTSNESTMSRFH